MAERYASQRSGNKPVRRRALPRVGESFNERDDDDRYDTYEDEPAAAATSRTVSRTATATATLPRQEVAGGTTTVIRPRTDVERETTMTPPRAGGVTVATRAGGTAAMPRRSSTGARVAPAPTAIRTDYGYVRRDLRRIAITAVAMFILLIVLNLIVRAIIH